MFNYTKNSQAREKSQYNSWLEKQSERPVISWHRAAVKTHQYSGKSLLDRVLLSKLQSDGLPECLESSLVERLCQAVGHLALCVDVLQLNCSSTHFLTYEIVLYLDVLHSGVKLRTLCYSDGSLIVAEDNRRLWFVHILWTDFVE